MGFLHSRGLGSTDAAITAGRIPQFHGCTGVVLKSDKASAALGSP
jgi:hypothetical protein